MDIIKVYDKTSYGTTRRLVRGNPSEYFANPHIDTGYVTTKSHSSSFVRPQLVDYSVSHCRTDQEEQSNVVQYGLSQVVSRHESRVMLLPHAIVDVP